MADMDLHYPGVILIIAGVFFLAFNDNVPGWILIALGFLLSIFAIYSRNIRKK